MKKTWISILIAAFIIAGIAAIGLVAGSAYWISRHVSTQRTSTESAQAEFDRERARFAGQEPMVDISGGDDNPTIRTLPAKENTRMVELQALHALVYDPDEGKLLRANIPFWLLRFGTSFSLMDRGSVSVAELERHGPGLIVNGHSDEGPQILLWID